MIGMQHQPWHRDGMSSGRSQHIALGSGLCVVPTLAAALLLMGGVASTDLTLVYASIAVSLVALPAFVYGVVCLVRALATTRRPLNADAERR
jgi:hypothetical protein